MTVWCWRLMNMSVPKIERRKLSLTCAQKNRGSDINPGIYTIDFLWVMISSCWKIKQTLYSTPCFTADALFYYYLFRNENQFVEQGSEFSLMKIRLLMALRKLIGMCHTQNPYKAKLSRPIQQFLLKISNPSWIIGRIPGGLLSYRIRSSEQSNYSNALLPISL